MLKTFRCEACSLDLGSPRALSLHFRAEPGHISRKALYNRFYRGQMAHDAGEKLDRCLLCWQPKPASSTRFCDAHNLKYASLDSQEAIARFLHENRPADASVPGIEVLPTLPRGHGQTARRTNGEPRGRVLKFCVECGGPRHKTHQRFCAFCGAKL